MLVKIGKIWVEPDDVRRVYQCTGHTWMNLLIGGNLIETAVQDSETTVDEAAKLVNTFKRKTRAQSEEGARKLDLADHSTEPVAGE